MEKKKTHQRRETAPLCVLGTTQTQAGKQRFSYFLQFPQNLTFVFVARRQLWIMYHDIKANSAESPSVHYVLLTQCSPEQSAHLAPLPCMYLCTAHPVLPQACQHPSTAEGNSVCGVFSSWIILWFVRTTREPMKCIHMQRWLQTPQRQAGTQIYPQVSPYTLWDRNERGCKWNFCRKKQTRLQQE